MNRIDNYKRLHNGESLKKPNKVSRIDALWQAILNNEKLPFKPRTRAEKELAKKLNNLKVISEPVIKSDIKKETEVK